MDKKFSLLFFFLFRGREEVDTMQVNEKNKPVILECFCYPEITENEINSERKL